MAIVFTTTFRVRNWGALRQVHREQLLAAARAVGARRCQVYRNRDDASQALLLAELPDEEVLGELRRSLHENLPCPLGASTAWESSGWETVP